ncbi:hypothetical protein Goshw_022986 [Gossypium schwendimanii]|uniref:Uncharacterized protein n=1 Tax=Gossypium schwendimanii TaxID=34291 RepID=A0A7J9LQG7_GOSSC|nr:hypothetical protein [Gossypium schwendimanii]
MEKSFVFLVFSCMLIKLGHVVPQAEATRAFFEFGDSLIDNGVFRRANWFWTANIAIPECREASCWCELCLCRNWNSQ